MLCWVRLCHVMLWYSVQHILRIDIPCVPADMRAYTYMRAYLAVPGDYVVSYALQCWTPLGQPGQVQREVLERHFVGSHKSTVGYSAVRSAV